jgi:hypothetical protein
MQYLAIEAKLRNVPIHCLDELDSFIDYLIFREEQADRQSRQADAFRYFGSVKSFGDGLKTQRQMRDEWN